jgi:protein-tyrosine phosphatase
MAELLLVRGVDIDGFVARRLSNGLIQQADLVLALTRAHRSLVAEAWPTAVRRTFTLREFARLLSGIDRAALPASTPADRLRAAVPLAAAQRGRWRAFQRGRCSRSLSATKTGAPASLAQILPAVEAIAQVAIGAASAERLTSAEPRGEQAQPRRRAGTD